MRHSRFFLFLVVIFSTPIFMGQSLEGGSRGCSSGGGPSGSGSATIMIQPELITSMGTTGQKYFPEISGTTMSDEVTWTVQEIAANQTDQSISGQQGNPRYLLREFGRRGREILPDVITAKYGDVFELTACVKDINGTDVCDTQQVIYEVDTPALVMPFACDLEFGSIVEMRTNSYSQSIKSAFLGPNAQESCVGDKPFTFIMEVAGSSFVPRSSWYRMNIFRPGVPEQLLYIKGPARPDDGCPDIDQKPTGGVFRDGTLHSLDEIIRDPSEIMEELKDMTFAILKQVSGGTFTSTEFKNMENEIEQLTGKQIIQYLVAIPLFASQLAPWGETIIDEGIIWLEKPGQPAVPLTWEKTIECLFKGVKNSINSDCNEDLLLGEGCHSLDGNPVNETQCENSYMGYCASGNGWTGCTQSMLDGGVPHDYHNCSWDSVKMTCDSSGSAIGENTCTLD